MSHISMEKEVVRSNNGELGPGRRLAIWVRGCPFRCSSCTTPELLKFSEPDQSIKELAERLLSYDDWTGLTISGGEPFEHSIELVALIHYLKLAKPDLDVLVYTGYSYKDIVADQKKLALVRNIDVMVDGLYRKDLHRNFLWAGGSENQFIRIINPRVKDLYLKQIKELISYINTEYETTVFQLHKWIDEDINDAESFAIFFGREWWNLQGTTIQTDITKLVTKLIVCLQTGSFAGIPPKGFRQSYLRSLRSKNINLIQIK